MSKADNPRVKSVDTPWNRFVETLMYSNGITSQAEFARRIGTAASTPGVWFREGTKPAFELVIKISEEFNKPLTEVMIHSGWATPEQLGRRSDKPTIALTNEELWMEMGRRLHVAPTEAVDEPAPVEESNKPRRKRGDAA